VREGGGKSGGRGGGKTPKRDVKKRRREKNQLFKVQEKDTPSSIGGNSGGEKTSARKKQVGRKRTLIKWARTLYNSRNRNAAFWPGGQERLSKSS